MANIKIIKNYNYGFPYCTSDETFQNDGLVAIDYSTVSEDGTLTIKDKHQNASFRLLGSSELIDKVIEALQELRDRYR